MKIIVLNMLAVKSIFVMCCSWHYFLCWRVIEALILCVIEFVSDMLTLLCRSEFWLWSHQPRFMSDLDTQIPTTFGKLLYGLCHNYVSCCKLFESLYILYFAIIDFLYEKHACVWLSLDQGGFYELPSCRIGIGL